MKASAKSPRKGAKSPFRIPAPRREWAYFFDIDGTLVDIAPTPSEIHFPEELRSTLLELYTATEGAVALISGRSIANIDSTFAGVQLPVAGQHGLERRDSRRNISRHDALSLKLERARDRLADSVRRHRGLMLEDKGLSLALHYRAAPSLAAFAHRLVRGIVSDIGPDYTIQRGKRVVELKPSGRDKGLAVREFMNETPFRGRTPVFVGDDVTDEHGFVVVNELGGHSVKVGGGPTHARWRLADVRLVRVWLENLEPRQTSIGGHQGVVFD